MANIMITDACNLRCKYCFADEFVNKQHKFMSMDDFMFVVNFILKSNENSFGIIGGEPTQHPQFKKILKACILHDKIQKIKIFTNGINIIDFADEYASSKINLLINCNADVDIGKENFETLVQGLDLLFEKIYCGERITLGVNIYHPKQNLDFIFELLERYRQKRVRVSVVTPSANSANSPKEYFADFIPLLFDFYKKLLDKNIMPRYDCNVIPKCVYTAEQYREFMFLLSKLGKDRDRIMSELNLCEPVIDILPNLEVVRCFGVSHLLKLNLHDFKNLRDLRGAYIKKIDANLINIENQDECRNCYEFIANKCNGGCLSFKKGGK